MCLFVYLLLHIKCAHECVTCVYLCMCISVYIQLHTCKDMFCNVWVGGRWLAVYMLSSIIQYIDFTIRHSLAHISCVGWSLHITYYLGVNIYNV